LTAHITDPVDAHQASAIGQAGYAAVNATWVEAVAGVGGTQNALTKLFDAANARPTWVLDANPAEKGDFVGPNALINAYAAIGTHRPIIYLRPGVYNWTNPAPFDGVTIIGASFAGLSVSRIQNLAGDMVVGIASHFSNVEIKLSGDLLFQGVFNLGFSTFNSVATDVSGDIRIQNVGNILDNVVVTGGTSQFLAVQQPGNTFRNCQGYQVRLQIAADYTKMDTVTSSDPVKYPALPAVFVETSHNILSQVKVADAPAGGISVAGNHNNVTDVTFDGVAGPGSATLVDIQGSHNLLNDISLNNLTGQGNRLVVVRGTGNHISSLSIENTVSQVPDFVSLGGTNNSIEGLTIDGVSTTLFSNLLQFDGSSCRVSGMRVTAVDGYNAPMVKFSGGGNGNNTLDVLAVSGVTSPGATLFGVLAFEGQGDIAREVTISGVPNQPALTSLVTFSNSSLSSVEHLRITGSTAPAGILIFLSGTSNTCKDVSLDAIGDLQANFKAIRITGNNATLNNIRFNGILSNTGATTFPLIEVFGTNVRIDGVLFQSIGTASGITVPLIRVSGGHGSIGNIKADGTVTTLNCGPIIYLSTITFGYPLRIHDVHGDNNSNSALSTENAFHSTASGIWTVENSYFSSRGAGSVTTSATVFVENCSGFVFKNVSIIATQGHAAAFPNAGGSLENVLISGLDLGVPPSSGAGRQLFHGYGFVGALVTLPLVLRDCTMEYGASNCNPTMGTGTGEPVIFFGGSGGTAVANHGSTIIDGLTITAGGSVVNQHRDGLIRVDIASQAEDVGTGVYKNISIDLKEITWFATGATRLDPWVFEIVGDGDDVPMALVENLSIKNIKESNFVDARSIVFAVGVRINGLTVDGPSTGVHGTSGFSATLVNLTECIASNIRIGTRKGIKLVSGNNAYLGLTRSKANEVNVLSNVVGSNFTYLCRMTGSVPLNCSLSNAVLNDTSDSTCLVAGIDIDSGTISDVSITIDGILSSTIGLRIFSGFGALVSNLSCYTTRAGVADQECLRITNSQDVVIRDSIFNAEGGRAGHVNDSGVTLERVQFKGGQIGNPPTVTGRQLFTGWGRATTNPISPLFIRDCVMEYGPSNCGNGTVGHPVIFLGGTLGASITDHGPLDVKGLKIRPSGLIAFTVPFLGQPRNTILAMSAAAASDETVRGLDCTFDDISIDLDNVRWIASGAARSTLIPSLGAQSAAIVEVAGFRSVATSHKIGAVCRNLQITGIRESSGPAIADLRFLLNAEGVRFENLLILGTNSGVSHGSGSFDADALSLGQCEVAGLRFGTTQEGLPRVKGNKVYLAVLGSHLNDVDIGGIPSSSVYESLVRTSQTLLGGGTSEFTSRISKLTSVQFVAPAGKLLDLEFGCDLFETSNVSQTSALPSDFLLLGGPSGPGGPSTRCLGNNLIGTAPVDEVLVTLKGLGTSFYGNSITSTTSRCRLVTTGTADQCVIFGNVLTGSVGVLTTRIDATLGSKNSITGNTLLNLGGASDILIGGGSGSLAANNTLA
jgi:hypothetical protein